MTETILLGIVALRSQLREDLTKTKLEWDPVKLAFTNHSEANQFLRREYRNGGDVRLCRQRDSGCNGFIILRALQMPHGRVFHAWYSYPWTVTASYLISVKAKY